MDGLSALIKDAPESSLFLLPREGMARSRQPAARKTAFTGACQAAPWPWTSTFRTVSNKCLLLADVLPVGFCYSGPGD